MLSSIDSTYIEDGLDHEKDYEPNEQSTYEEVIVEGSIPEKKEIPSNDYEITQDDDLYQVIIPVKSITKKDIQINVRRKTLQVLIKPKVRTDSGLFNQSFSLPVAVNRKDMKMRYRQGKLIVTVKLRTS